MGERVVIVGPGEEGVAVDGRDGEGGLEYLVRLTDVSERLLSWRSVEPA